MNRNQLNWKIWFKTAVVVCCMTATIISPGLATGGAVDIAAANWPITSTKLTPDKLLSSPPTEMVKPDQSDADNFKAAEQSTPAVDKSLAQILEEFGITGTIPDLKIRVFKSAHTLTVYSGTIPLKTYHCATGENGLDDKKISGDHKTPEGIFYISETEILDPADYYLGTRWMRVSYPNIEDAERGLMDGIIDQATHDEIVYAIQNHLTPPQDTALGGGIGIHGGSGNNNETQGNFWTYGCIGLSDKDVNEIFDYITVGTTLVIEP